MVKLVETEYSTNYDENVRIILKQKMSIIMKKKRIL